MTQGILAGTRGSELALKQAGAVAVALSAAHPELKVEIVVVRTEGDRRTDLSLTEAGGQGVFVKDIEAKLLRDELDVAVHSLKDVPAEQGGSLTLGAILPRADVRDVLVTRTGERLESLEAGSRIGTDSRRRAVQLLALRPDLRVEGIRGNVPTRIEKAQSGEYDGVVVAAAGMERLGCMNSAAQVFSLEEILPSPGQGAIAVQCRAENARTLALLHAIDDAKTSQAVSAERGFLRRLGAGCRLPVAAYAAVENGSVRLKALLANDQGQIFSAEASATTDRATELGEDLAEELGPKAGLVLEARSA